MISFWWWRCLDIWSCQHQAWVLWLQSQEQIQCFQADVCRVNTTHVWCEFLSDSDFQYFMKILMKKCLMQSSTYNEGDKMELSPHRPMSPSQNQIVGLWHLSIFQVSIIYFFNVLLHTFDKSFTFMKTILVAIHECLKWWSEKDSLRSCIQAWSSQLPITSVSNNKL